MIIEMKVIYLKMLYPSMCHLMEYKISDPISQLPFMTKMSEIDWPLSPEQLPPLIIKPKMINLKENNNNIQYNPTIKVRTSPNIQRKHIQPTNTLSYEKNRMNKLVRQIENFHYERSQPFIWMQSNFGKTITQKEFNRIYRELKEILPAEKAPNRDVNRNQRLRYKWMDDIWEDSFSRNILQTLITRTMLYSE